MSVVQCVLLSYKEHADSRCVFNICEPERNVTLAAVNRAPSTSERAHGLPRIERIITDFRGVVTASSRPIGSITTRYGDVDVALCGQSLQFLHSLFVLTVCGNLTLYAVQCEALVEKERTEHAKQFMGTFARSLL